MRAYPCTFGSNSNCLFSSQRCRGAKPSWTQPGGKKSFNKNFLLSILHTWDGSTFDVNVSKLEWIAGLFRAIKLSYSIRVRQRFINIALSVPLKSTFPGKLLSTESSRKKTKMIQPYCCLYFCFKPRREFRATEKRSEACELNQLDQQQRIYISKIETNKINCSQGQKSEQHPQHFLEISVRLRLDLIFPKVYWRRSWTLPYRKLRRLSESLPTGSLSLLFSTFSFQLFQTLIENISASHFIIQLLETALLIMLERTW